MRSQQAIALKLTIIAIVVALGVLAYLVSSGSVAGFSATSGGRGYDPLTPLEQRGALRATLADSRAQSHLANSARTETLLIERHQEDKATRANGSWLRRADVYVYDYEQDTLIHSLVDVASGAVEQVETIVGTQLPLTQNETQAALDIAWAQTAIRTQLEIEFLRMTGEQLTSLDQINSKAFVFYAAAMPQDLGAEAQLCGYHRCAQLLLFTEDNVAFELLPIVDLSEQQVVQAVFFGVDGATHVHPLGGSHE